MEKIEVPVIKEYLEKFVEEKLSNNELFIKTYGKNFVNKRLNKNLDKVYIDKSRNDIAGCFGMQDKSITLYLLDDETLDVKKIIEKIDDNQFLKFVILHETVHAIFCKSELEKKIQGIKCGTGIMEIRNDGTCVGKGINEGMTNWICEKSGVKAELYRVTTDCTRKLEDVIGEENMMKMARGNIKRNVLKQLGIDEEHCINLLSVFDQIIGAEKIYDQLMNIKNILIIYKDYQNLSEKDQEMVDKEYRKIKENRLYKVILEFKNKKLQDSSFIDMEIECYETAANNVKKKVDMYVQKFNKELAYIKYKLGMSKGRDSIFKIKKENSFKKKIADLSSYSNVEIKDTKSGYGEKRINKDISKEI